MIAPLSLLLCMAPPPAPAEEGASESSPPAEQPSPGEVTYDERGNPSVPYAEPEETTEELQWADESPPPPELEYADAPEGAELEYSDLPPEPEASEGALARQDTVNVAEDIPPESYESRQRFALELKFGPYVPSVDRPYEGEGFGPYATIFGETDGTGAASDQPRPGLFSVIAFDWQFYDLGGPFSVGTSIGFFRDTADALLADPDPDAESVRSSADSTTFSVIPVTLLVGYRFELLADRYRVPLVPYAKAGLGYGFWWTKAGNGNLSTNSAGEKGRGGSLGWQANLGGMLRLDWLEFSSARTLDRTTGINHTYLFGEYQISRLNGFNSGKRLHVGDDTWLLGLAIEF